MVVIDGYSIEEFPNTNKIVIQVPKFTASSEGSSSDRSKLSLSAGDLAALLTLAKGAYERSEDGDTTRPIEYNKHDNSFNSSFPSIDTVATGAKIRGLRKSVGLSVMELTRALNLTSDQSIYKWQRGDSHNLVALAHLFNVKVDDILVLNDN